MINCVLSASPLWFVVLHQTLENMCLMKPSSDSFGWYKWSNESDPLLCEIPGFGDSSLFADPNQPPIFMHWHLPPGTWTMKSLPITSVTIMWPNLLNFSKTTVVLDSDSLVGNTLAFECNNCCPVISNKISFWTHCYQFASKEWHISSPMCATITLLKKILLKRILIPFQWPT